MNGKIGTVVLPLLALCSAGYASWHVYRANQPLLKAAPPIPPVTAPFRAPSPPRESSNRSPKTWS